MSSKNFCHYVMGFPSVLVGAFFLILIFKREILYAPQDFSDPTHFIELLQASKYLGTADSESINGFINTSEDNKTKVFGWMKDNDLASESFTFFLSSDLYADQHRKLIKDLRIT